MSRIFFEFLSQKHRIHTFEKKSLRQKNFCRRKNRIHSTAYSLLQYLLTVLKGGGTPHPLLHLHTNFFGAHCGGRDIIVVYYVTLFVDGAISVVCVGNHNKYYVQPKLHALRNERLSGTVDKMLYFVRILQFFTSMKAITIYYSISQQNIPYSVVSVRNHD